MIHISHATSEQLPEIMAIDAATNSSAWSLAWWQSVLQSDLDTVLVAQNKQGAILAFIVWQTIVDEMELHLIATATEYRQQGIAQMLMQEMFQAASTANIVRIMLEVRASNHAAQNLYRKLGFSATAVRQKYYRDGEDAVLMEKII
ncbi:ribosomal protein S18-alanine N-acetyltransferase [Wielerella bovis]|uniref:ribosomal protein S18-alanine N-acetyltransferase n=1 Tax=Wielerella bovis TaxID=2917790 RepID=UPI002019E740|nr:ribosomal protein S18-alanine N-acetyltransferase [Wielerella bovis]ULJ62311.1 ribosomal protein S18-alanine N-acetyltransferase [Wielerella bovis]